MNLENVPSFARNVVTENNHFFIGETEAIFWKKLFLATVLQVMLQISVEGSQEAHYLHMKFVLTCMEVSETMLKHLLIIVYFEMTTLSEITSLSSVWFKSFLTKLRQF